MPKIDYRSFSLVLLGLSMGMLLAESLYRVHLYINEPYYFQDDRFLWYLQESPIDFNEEFGFSYIPGTYVGGAIYDHRVTHCWDPMQEWVINERGNSGRIRGSYEDAELKILVFGDSVTQRPRKNELGEHIVWPNFLQDYLVEKLSKTVHVVNFGRDGYGLLQMFDLAAAKVAEWKPDFFIIAFVSDDVTRDRFWRSVTNLDGRRRVMVSRTPDPDPDWATAAEAFMIEPRATHEWCKQLLESGAIDDPLVQELEASAIESRRRNSLLADPLSLTKSYIFEQVVYGSPYHSSFNQDGPTQMPRHALASFGLDEKLEERISSLERLKIPYLIMHLAGYSEILSRVEFDEKRAHYQLIQSLEELTGKKIIGTLENIDVSEFDVDRIPVDPKGDTHPSLYGHQFYARAALNVVLNHACADSACETISQK